METLMYQTPTKAIKEHVCDFCSGIIMKGSTYCKSTHKHDGEIYNWQTHIDCEYIATKLNMYEDCDDDGLTQDDFMENVFEAHIKFNDCIFSRKRNIEIQ